MVLAEIDGNADSLVITSRRVWNAHYGKKTWGNRGVLWIWSSIYLRSWSRLLADKVLRTKRAPFEVRMRWHGMRTASHYSTLILPWMAQAPQLPFVPAATNTSNALFTSNCAILAPLNNPS